MHQYYHSFEWDHDNNHTKLSTPPQKKQHQQTTTTSHILSSGWSLIVKSRFPSSFSVYHCSEETPEPEENFRGFSGKKYVLGFSSSRVFQDFDSILAYFLKILGGGVFSEKIFVLGFPKPKWYPDLSAAAPSFREKSISVCEIQKWIRIECSFDPIHFERFWINSHLWINQFSGSYSLE